jgi:uncharacterized protein (TIGR02466 family)
LRRAGAAGQNFKAESSKASCNASCAPRLQARGHPQFWGEGKFRRCYAHFRGLVDDAGCAMVRPPAISQTGSPMLDKPAAANPASAHSAAMNAAAARSPAAAPIELTAKQVFKLFPTPLFTGKLSDLGICDRIETKLRELQKSGRGVSLRHNAMHGYMTPDDIQTLPEMQELVEVILRESAQILDAYAIKRDSHYITNMWANITHPNRTHSMHMHPNCLFSGLVYIRTPKNCGPTLFASPRQLVKNLEPTYLVKNELNADVFVMPPEKGRMLLWPSHVPHSVEEGSAADGAEDRIVVAFNISIRGKIEIPTAHLSLR